MKELDCRGMPCPRPVIELAKVFPALAIGEVVAVASDDPAARYDIPAWCRLREQEFLGEETAEDGVPRYLVRKGATDAAASPP
jgi:TusA-related sulfurtransferase